MSQPIASSSSSAEDRDSPPPPPPPNTPTSTPSYPRLPGVGGDASGTPGGSNWSTALAKRAVPYFDASKINPEIIPGIAGAVAGLVSGVVTCPLDVIKTKLQAQGAAWGKKREPRYRGLIGTTKVILQEEGVRGMYRGLGPLILGYLPTWTVYFFVYENMKKKMETRVQNKFVIHFSSSLCAGAASTICTNPIWVIKTRLMSQKSSAQLTSPATLRNSPFYYYNTWDAAKKMYTHEGIRSFYSGLGPALLGLTHVGVQFPIYEYLKRRFTGGKELGEQDEGGKTNWAGILAASCISKFCASAATYPHEVLRTRLQTQRILNGHAEKSGIKRESSFPRYRGILHSARTIYREEGWRAFYSGMGTNMVRAVPSSAMTLLTYELVKQFVTRLREESVEYYGHEPYAKQIAQAKAAKEAKKARAKARAEAEAAR